MEPEPNQNQNGESNSAESTAPVSDAQTPKVDPTKPSGIHGVHANIAYGDRQWKPLPPTTAKTQFTELGNPQFSILELMVITTISFAGLIAISKVGLAGTIILFIVSFSVFFYLGRMNSIDAVRYRFWNQVVWGIVMPMACVFGDIFVFGEYHNGVPLYFSSYAVGCYAFMAWQMMFLAGSWFASPNNQFFNQFVVGTFIAAATFCYFIAIFLTPLAAIAALFMGLGLPGFTPLITGNMFRGSARMHRARSGKNPAISAIEVFGFIAAFLVGMIGYGASIVFAKEIQSMMADNLPWLQ